MKNISNLGKWAFIFYPTFMIVFASPITLFAQASPKFPDAENRGLPERTGGAGGRVKPELPPDKADSADSEPPITEAGGENFDRFNRRSPYPGLLPKKKGTRLTFPLEENINKSSSNWREGGAKAGGSCVRNKHDKPFLKALIPPVEHIGKTVKNNPSLFVYLPENTANMGEFFVYNDQYQEVYRTSLKLPNTPGVIKLTIPESAKLENNKGYRWYFSVICDPNDRSSDEYIKGDIQKIKIDPLLSRQLLNAKPLELAKIYAKNRIWYDTMDAISTVKKDYQLDWESLLTSVGLEKFAKEPLVDCCTPESNVEKVENPGK